MKKSVNQEIGKVYLQEQVTGKPYHMNYGALLAFQPEKAKLLKEHFYRICRNNVPVYDLTTRTVYKSMGLIENARSHGGYVGFALALQRAIETQTPLNFNSNLPGMENNSWQGHMFMYVEDVPIQILKEAFKHMSEEQEKEVKEAKRLKMIKEIMLALREKGDYDTVKELFENICE